MTNLLILSDPVTDFGSAPKRCFIKVIFGVF